MIAFQTRYRQYLETVEQALPAYLPMQAKEQGGLPVEAARYSLLAGGKCVRPVLLLAVCDFLGAAHPAAMPLACALEMIHTYSLIHDDLPCMDDDSLRRGRPTCHMVYGVAIAMLAGDTLLNRAYEVILEAAGQPEALQAARIISSAAGSQGMIGGQALDIAGSAEPADLDWLARMHSMKTGALIQAPVMAAACLARAAQPVRSALQAFSSALGLAFQIRDDILDATAGSNQLGKTAGKDQRDAKPTYVTLLGLQEADRQMEKTTGLARDALDQLQRHGLDPSFLSGLTEFLLERDR